MTAFHLTVLKITDKEKFMAYAEKARPLLAQFGGKYLAAGRPAGSVEGEPISDPVVLTEWPSVEAIKNFWSSPEYSELKKLREGAVEVNSTIINSAGTG